jgi:negative regulator of flagellin synthesis FlgM
MTEKINGQGLRTADTAAARRSEAARTATQGRSEAPKTETPVAKGDTVNITQSGLLLSRLEEAVQRAPVVDTARVAEIKARIAAGTYEFDDQRTADRLLQFERDVLG